jgi:hypothetical protein
MDAEMKADGKTSADLSRIYMFSIGRNGSFISPTGAVIIPSVGPERVTSL